MADRAVIGDVRQFVPMLDRYAAASLFFVVKRLDQQRRREYLVARRIQQVRARHVGRANRLAFSATQAVLDGIGDDADVRLLHDEGLVPQKAETRRIGPPQIAARHELVLVEPAAGIDPVLVAAKWR